MVELGFQPIRSVSPDVDPKTLPCPKIVGFQLVRWALLETCLSSMNSTRLSGFVTPYESCQAHHQRPVPFICQVGFESVLSIVNGPMS